VPSLNAGCYNNYLENFKSGWLCDKVFNIHVFGLGHSYSAQAGSADAEQNHDATYYYILHPKLHP